MSKNIYIGDIHGSTIWKDIVAAHPDAATITFIGDYFDSFNVAAVDQLHNVKEIVEFKTTTDTNVNLLIGNHDHHYWPGVGGSGTSGYQVVHSFQFEQFFKDNKHHFKMAALVGNVLCTHAGVSPIFLKDNGWVEPLTDDQDDDIVEFLNDLFTYKPKVFQFNGREPYGDDVYQTPIWIRPRSLQNSNKEKYPYNGSTYIKDKYIQVVGHTVQNTIDIEGKATGGKYFYIDTLPVGQYLIEGDGEFKIGYVNLDK